jgi:hypothetical protein
MRKRHHRDTRFVERLASENTPAQGLRSEVAPQKIHAGGRFWRKEFTRFFAMQLNKRVRSVRFWGDPAFTSSDDDVVESSSALVAEERALPRSLPEVSNQ